MFASKLSEWSLLFSCRCFIPNIYAALFTAALVPLTCLVVVFVVFVHAYQVKPQWKAYDDVFRGRTNAAGVQETIFVLWRWELFNGGESVSENFLSKKRVKLYLAFSSVSEALVSSGSCFLVLPDLSFSLGLHRFYSCFQSQPLGVYPQGFLQLKQ